MVRPRLDALIRAGYPYAAATTYTHPPHYENQIMNSQCPQQSDDKVDADVVWGAIICAVLLAIAAGVSYAEWSVMTSRFGYDASAKSVVLGLSWATTFLVARNWWKKLTAGADAPKK